MDHKEVCLQEQSQTERWFLKTSIVQPALAGIVFFFFF